MVVLQHNYAAGGQVVEAVLETAVRMEADLVLIQEPRKVNQKDSTRSHPSVTLIKVAEQDRVKCWIAFNWASTYWVTELKDQTGDYGN
jgi:hypothetical protein